MDAATFLDAIHGTGLDDGLGKILVWTLRGAVHTEQSTKRSAYFDNADDAAAYAAEQGLCNVYFGVALCPDGLSERQRATAATVTSLGCLWADIDFHKEGARRQYPRTQEDALQVVNGVGLKPSIVTHSGGGLQAFWLFNEAWDLTEGNERDEAAALAQRWIATIRAEAGRHGWDLDPVHDLARVMRLPGTENPKYMPPRMVEVIDHNDHRYNPEDFDQFLVAPEYVGENAVVTVDGLRIDAAVTTPSVVTSLAGSDDRFRKTWMMQRTDGEARTWTASEYTLALANEGVYRGWSDQTIADAIIAWRREHNQRPEKALRVDYLMRTIGKAKSNRRSLVAAAEAEQAVPETPPQPGETISASNRREFLDHLSGMLLCKVERFVRLTGEQPVYLLSLSQPRVTLRLGTSADVMNFGRMRQLFFDQGVMLPKALGKRWGIVERTLLRVVEDVENPENTLSGRLSEWLADYLIATAMHGEDFRPTQQQRQPFVRDGMLHINAAHFRQHLENRGEKIARRDLFADLRVMGFDTKGVVPATGRRTTISYWAIPVDDASEFMPDSGAYDTATDGGR